MTNTLKRLLHETAAQDLAEYGIALAVIGLAAAAAALATDVNGLWTRALQAIEMVVDG